MKVGTGLTGRSPSEIAESARNAESRGFDVFSSSETNHNPYLPLAIAAEHTENITLRTSIALAFARNPMDTAYIAWDLAGKYPRILEDEVVGEAATALFSDAQAMLNKLIDEKLIRARAVFGFWPANQVQNDDLEV